MSLSLFGSVTNDAGARVDQFFSSLNFGPLAIIDLVIVAVILYWLYTILRETRALGIIYGIFVLILLYIAARVLKLELLTLLVANFLTLLFVAIPVLFQPELRRALEKLGRTRLGTIKDWKKSEYKRVVAVVSEAVSILSTNRTGALIVLRRRTGLADVMTTGTVVDARLSTPLLLNLFYDKSPLHDGAVVIDGDRIAAAGVMLPLSEHEYSYTLGARHRAAAGLTEQTDALVIVVSEEKGVISLVAGGKITPGVSAQTLPHILDEFFTRKQPTELMRKFRNGRRDRKTKTETKEG